MCNARSHTRYNITCVVLFSHSAKASRSGFPGKTPLAAKTRTISFRSLRDPSAPVSHNGRSVSDRSRNGAIPMSDLLQNLVDEKSFAPS